MTRRDDKKERGEYFSFYNDESGPLPDLWEAFGYDNLAALENYPIMTPRFRTTKNIQAYVCVLLVTLLLPLSSAALPFAGSSPGNKLVASDREDGDEFGSSVAIDGATIVVGAYSEDGAGDNRGAAYVYDRDTGVELMKLTASDGVDHDRLGVRVSVSGNLAVVSAFRSDVGGSDRGAAYVYDLTTGEELYKLVASDGQDTDRFGIDAEVSGHLVVVGAWAEDGSGGVNANRGAAYVFDLSQPNIPNPGFPNVLNENTKLTASDAADGDNFGQSVDVFGTLAIVGSDGKDNEGSSQGGAYVFDLTTGEELYQLVASDRQNDDSFGFTVGISERYAIVGAYREDGSGGGTSADRGAAYVYDLQTGDEVYKLTASDSQDEDLFGVSVAVSGKLAVVGARGEDGVGTERGAAYAFDLTSGNEMQKLTAADAEDNDRFADNVAIDGDYVISGAIREDGAGDNRGAAYLNRLSMFQPDLTVGPSPFSTLGNSVYAENNTNQVLNLVSVRLRRLKGWVTLQNDGNTSDDFLCSATSGNRYFSVAYFRVQANQRNNLTAALLAGSHRERNVVPGESGRLICAEIAPSRSLRKKKKNRRGRRRVTYLRKRHSITVSATSSRGDFKSDSVRVGMRTR